MTRLRHVEAKLRAYNRMKFVSQMIDENHCWCSMLGIIFQSARPNSKTLSSNKKNRL